MTPKNGSPELTLSQQAYSVIEDMIISGSIPAGSYITEPELVEKTGLGRTPIREALQRLAAAFPVAIVDKVVDAKGTREVARAYLEFQYSKEIQQLLARHNLRVHDPEVVAATADQFAKVRLVDPATFPGGWEGIQKTHFASGGLLDQLLAAGRH